MKWKLIAGILLLALAGSLLLNGVLLREARGLYFRSVQSGVYPLALAPLNLEEMSGGVLLFGDSRVAEWNPIPLASSVQKHGVSGASTNELRNLWNRISAKNQVQPEHVVIQAGINDLRMLGKSEDQAVTDQCLSNLKDLATEIHEATGAEIRIFSIWPTSKVPWQRKVVWNKRIEKARVEVNTKLAAWCETEEKIGFLDVDSLLAPEGIGLAELYRDTLHLTPDGYERLNQVLAEEGLISTPSGSSANR